ncbi:MAG: hypothetical protein ACRDJ9_36045, partial [Dehalococcoidia bacterium]
AAEFGTLKASLQTAGQVIAGFDLLIAATALIHRLQLITHNTRHFNPFPTLPSTIGSRDYAHIVEK